MFIGNLLQCLYYASLNHYLVKSTVAFTDSFIYIRLSAYISKGIAIQDLYTFQKHKALK